MNRSRVPVAIVVVVLTALAGFAVWTLADFNSDVDRTAAYAKAHEQPISRPTKEVAALWIGDSYTEGVGAGGLTANLPGSLACLASDAMDWICNMDAQGGTGFSNPGSTKGWTRVAPRLPKDAESYRADVLILDVGRNDADFPPDVTAERARADIQRITKLFPKSRIVVIAPYLINNAPRAANLEQVIVAERETAAKIGAYFIDPVQLGWITAENAKSMTASDGVHPNDAGHRYIADHLVKEFRRIGLPEGG